MKPYEIEGLKEAVERKLGVSPKVHSDYDELSLKLGGALSCSTLKRMWGYNTDHEDISAKSVDILAKCLGYDNYREFIDLAALTSDDQHKLYTASKVASLGCKFHSDRYVNSFQLFSNCEYENALKSLQLNEVNADNLNQTLSAFVDYARSMGEELFLKSISLWSCGYDVEGTIIQIEEILTKALQLAQSINDHSLQSKIYLQWAHCTFTSGVVDRALELYDLAIWQGRISKLEDEDNYPCELLLSINDKAYVLYSTDRAEEALELIEQAMSYEENTVVAGYLRLNYAAISSSVNNETDQVELYKDILVQLEQWHIEFDPINESVALEAITNYNLGVSYHNLLDEKDYSLAAEYYRKAIEVFNSRDVRTSEYKNYLQSSIELLAELDSMNSNGVDL